MKIRHYPADPFMASNIKVLQNKRKASIKWLGEQLKDNEKATQFVDDLLFAAINETNDFHRRAASINELEPFGVTGGYDGAFYND